MTTPQFLGLLAALIGSGGVGGSVTAWLTARTPKNGEREDALISRLQEMVNHAAERERASQAREAALLNYIWQLQRHINTGQPPPPPPWPDELVTR